MTLTTAPAVVELDMPDWIGQRAASFRFKHINAVTGEVHPDLTPLRDSTPTLSHDTSRTIKRQIQGLNLGVVDTRLINVIQSRLLVYMIIDDVEWPLGRYMFADSTETVMTGDNLGSTVLYDEMFIVDQQLENGYTPKLLLSPASSFVPLQTNSANSVQDLLSGLPVVSLLEATPYFTSASWPAGTFRGSCLEQLSIDGDWFSPWFDNTGVMRFIRTFDPASAIVTFDLDIGNRVGRNTIFESNDLIGAPNRFVVISNGATTTEGADVPLVGIYDVPSSAPHSILNRGFVISSITERQLNTTEQCQAAAENLGIRQTIFERVELITPPDPRHDSYDVIRWQGENWLELAWSLPLVEGGGMSHIMRKAYS